MKPKAAPVNGELFRSLRLKAGYVSTEALALEAGVDVKSVRKAERGELVLPNVLGLISPLLGVTWQELLACPEPAPTLVRTFEELLSWNLRIVAESTEILVTTGSRSRDESYLRQIELRLREVHRLVHYRVLLGPPFMEQLKEHLARVIEEFPPDRRTHGAKKANIGILHNLRRYPECFICANEKHALVVQPSFSGNPSAYDSAVVHHSTKDVQGLINHVKVLYAAATPLESRDEVERLEVMPDSCQYV